MTATSTATGTIKNDDEAVAARAEEGARAAGFNVTLSVDKARIIENGNATTITVTVTSTSAFITEQITTVNVGSAGSTADYSDDYSRSAGSFQIKIPGDSKTKTATGTFQLAPNDDTKIEGNESILLTGSTNFSDVGVTGTTIWIIDNEIGLATSPTSVNERDAARTVTVTASVGAVTTARTLAVSVGKSGDSATEGTDYTTVNDFNVTIPANATSATGTFTLTPTKDNTPEADETISITGTSTGYNVVGTSMTLTDRSINLSLNKTSISEGNGSTTVTVTATAAAISSARTVRMSVRAGTATQGTDYGTNWDFNLTIAANQTTGTATFNFNPIQDGEREANETVLVSGNLSGYTVNGATLTIQDDDTVPDISLNLSESGIGEGDNAKTITVRLWASVEKTWGRTVKVSVGQGGDSATEGTDYNTVADFDITIPPSPADPSGNGSFTLTPKQDTQLEGTERITVSGSNSSWSVGTKHVKLYDDDADDHHPVGEQDQCQRGGLGHRGDRDGHRGKRADLVDRGDRESG